MAGSIFQTVCESEFDYYLMLKTQNGLLWHSEQSVSCGPVSLSCLMLRTTYSLIHVNSM